MFSEKKEFMRSIRMTKTIKDYVEQAEGNGFNDKFEKLVLKGGTGVRSQDCTEEGRTKKD